MKSVKFVKESPSSLAFSSPKKRHIISELIATRNIIKNKFKRAYTDRLKRERERSEVFKPITTSLTKWRNVSPRVIRKEEIKKDEPLLDSIFKPRSLHTSTPKNTVSSKKRSRTNIATTDNDSDTDYKLQPSTLTGVNQSKQFSLKPANVDDHENFTYEIHFDNDTYENYDIMPDPNMLVDLTQTHKATMRPRAITARFGDLPLDTRKAWVLYRQQLARYLKNPVKESPLNIARDETEFDDFSDAKAEQSGVKSHAGSGVKLLGKSIDFDFIPYNVNNHIVYEYFDDPNELCDRLRLLVSSKMAGNTNHMQEINSIIEELRELDYIV